MRLNIIGNGFDLYHGLPCSYYYFGCFLAKYYENFYIEMSNMFNFRCFKCVGYEEFETYVDNIFWSSFEEKLGHLDSIWMEDSLMDDLGLECDDPIDIMIPEEDNANKIKGKFCDWISTTVSTKQNYKIIRKWIKGKKLKFDSNDYFVNFNYTQTLQEIYRIPDAQIYHIHGKCLEGESCNLIVGHGNDKAIKQLDEKIADIESETYYLQEQSVRNRLNEYYCERNILKELRKSVSRLISNLEFKLDCNVTDVDEILIWGFSCGEVDKPYLTFLRERYPKAKWKFSYYNTDEKSIRKEYVTELGLDESEVDYFELNNSTSEIIRKEIVSANAIEEF